MQESGVVLATHPLPAVQAAIDAAHSKPIPALDWRYWAGYVKNERRMRREHNFACRVVMGWYLVFTSFRAAGFATTQCPVEWIAKNSGLQVRRVYRALRSLRMAGVLITIRRKVEWCYDKVAKVFKPKAKAAVRKFSHGALYFVGARQRWRRMAGRPDGDWNDDNAEHSMRQFAGVAKAAAERSRLYHRVRKEQPPPDNPAL